MVVGSLIESYAKSGSPQYASTMVLPASGDQNSGGLLKVFVIENEDQAAA
jgi:hypothetical protein